MSSSIIFNASGEALICFRTGPFPFPPAFLRGRLPRWPCSTPRWAGPRRQRASAAGLGISMTFDSSALLLRHDSRGRGGVNLIEVVAELHRLLVSRTRDVDVKGGGQTASLLLATVHLHQFSLHRFIGLESLFQPGKDLRARAWNCSAACCPSACSKMVWP